MQWYEVCRINGITFFPLDVVSSCYDFATISFDIRPPLFILHYSGLEVFHWPPLGNLHTILIIVFCNCHTIVVNSHCVLYFIAMFTYITIKIWNMCMILFVITLLLLNEN